jgi:peptide/nickel transport system substrate-binding protein
MVLLVGLVVGNAGAQAAPQKTLTIGINQFPHSLHPSFDAMAATAYILGFARRPLTAYDTNWRLVCMLCETVPTLENGLAKVVPVPTEVGDHTGRGIEVTFRLREGATWGDGTPITSDDVVFTWQVGKHPLTGYTAVETFNRILDIKVIDARTFTLVRDRVSFSYASSGDFRILPKHLEQEAFADPARYRERSLYNTAPTTPGLWSGPWRISTVERGVQVVLERNPAWTGPAPAFDRVVIKAIENSAALEANLLSGGLDMIAGEVGVDVDQAQAFEKRHSDRYSVLYRPALYYEHLEPRLDSPQLSDLRVRRALLMGLDRPALSARLFGGKVPVAVSSVSPLDWVYDKTLEVVPYDPKAAADLLDQAGWTVGEDGIRQRDGVRLSIDLQTTAGNRTRERVEQVIQAQWKALGVEVVIRNLPPRVLFGDVLDQRKFTGLALFAWISAPENPPRSTLHCEEIPSAENGWRGQNYTGYCNPEMDRLIDSVEVELDESKRAEIWRQIQQLYAHDLPALPLYFRAEAYLLPQWLEGVTPTGHMNYSSLGAEYWRDNRP